MNAEYSAEEVRARFEAWVSVRSWFKATIGLDRSDDEYADPCINSRWQGWQAAYAESIKADEGAVPDVNRRVGWMLESVDGKGWWDGRAKWDFTLDPNGAVVFPSRSSADFQRLAMFHGEVIVTEHVWITHPPAQAAQSKVVYQVRHRSVQEGWSEWTEATKGHFDAVNAAIAHGACSQTRTIQAEQSRAVPEGIRERLIRLQVGGCSCGTKTPELKYHDEGCHYRMAAEIQEMLYTTPSPGESA